MSRCALRLLAACLLALTPCGLSAAPAMKILTGHLPPGVAKLTPFGTLPASNQLQLAIGVPLRDPNGLDEFLAALYNPDSLQYRHYLTPGQFTEKFGPTAADYAAVTAFAQQNHLTLTGTHDSRIIVDVSGSAADIQRAFHLTMRAYHHPTEDRDFFAPDAEPSVEASLPIADISGLNNFVLPHPRSLRRHPGQTRGAAPRTGSGPQTNYQGLDFRAAYLPDVSLTGTGQIVGLLEFDGFYQSDINAYAAAAGLPVVPVQTVLLDHYNGQPTTGQNSGNPEVSLDIEMAMSMAPGLSKIVSFEAGPNGLQNDILTAMTENTNIFQFSCSWGWAGGPTASTDNLFKKMAAQGQSFFDAAGDSDAFTTGNSSVNGIDNPDLDNAPSSSPFITVVGGTSLGTAGAGGSWFSETVWNWGYDTNSGSYVGGSGGISSYYSLPPWQSGLSMAANGGSTAFRNTPDVAMAADNIWVDYGDGMNGSFGGTSCATPLWAAVAALMNEQAAAAGKPNVGFLNPALYALGQSGAYGYCFHDITNGNNFWPSSPDAFSAVPGYDLCTGWGTPAGQALINAIAGQPDALVISPYTGFTAAGAVGGPFSPSGETLELTNGGAGPLTWSVAGAPPWLAVTPPGGALAASATASVSINLAGAAFGLGPGYYVGEVVVSNQVSQIAQNLFFNLQVGQSILQNGGFETGDFTGWALVGSTVVHSYYGTVLYDGVESLTSKYPLVVHSGDFGAFLGDDAVATLSQTVAVVPGQTYLLSLWFRNPSAGSSQEFTVDWNAGGAVNTIFSVVSPPSFGWSNLQFFVAAPGPTATLELQVENAPNFFGLDDVSLTPLPPLGFAAAALAGNALNLSWPAAGGLSYQIQSSTNLLQTNWSDLGGPITPAGGLATMSDTNASAASSQRFYRLLLLPPP